MLKSILVLGLSFLVSLAAHADPVLPSQLVSSDCGIPWSVPANEIRAMFASGRYNTELVNLSYLAVRGNDASGRGFQFCSGEDAPSQNVEVVISALEWVRRDNKLALVIDMTKGQDASACLGSVRIITRAECLALHPAGSN